MIYEESKYDLCELLKCFMLVNFFLFYVTSFFEKIENDLCSSIQKMYSIFEFELIN